MTIKENEIFDTVIIGGGIAGLTAANELKKSNILVLEKEEECGGRTLSYKFGDYIFNSGAQVVLGKATKELAKKLNVTLTLINKKIIPLSFNNKIIKAQTQIGFLLSLPLNLQDKIKLAKMILLIRYKYGSWFKKELDVLDPRLNILFNSTLEDLFGSFSSIPLKNFWDGLSRGSNTVKTNECAAFQIVDTFLCFAHKEYFVEGGTGRLTKALWDQVKDKTITSAKVTKIIQNEKNVEITFNFRGAQKIVKARHCVIAIPAPLILSITNNLPILKQKVLSKFVYGSYTVAGFLLDQQTKYYLDKGIWRIPVIGHENLISITDPTFTYSESYKKKSGQGLLRVYTGNESSKKLQGLSDDEALSILIKELVSIFPNIKKHIIKSSLRHWEHAIYYIKTGDLEYMQQVKLPVDKIHFCGDYTIHAGLEAAVNSGYRVAKEVLKDEKI